MSGAHVPFRPTTLAEARRYSGQPWRPPTRHRRFVLLSVTGYTITPGNDVRSGGANRAQSTWAVCDSHAEWREVAVFYPEGGNGLSAHEAARRLCLRLNNEDAR